jgi:hypothetical protein
MGIGEERPLCDNNISAPKKSHRILPYIMESDLKEEKKTIVFV